MVRGATKRPLRVQTPPLWRVQVYYILYPYIIQVHTHDVSTISTICEKHGTLIVICCLFFWHICCTDYISNMAHLSTYTKKTLPNERQINCHADLLPHSSRQMRKYGSCRPAPNGLLSAGPMECLRRRPHGTWRLRGGRYGRT